MITLYGIKTCDTVQKALKWLAAHSVPHTFHDYRELGIDKATIERWLKHLPLEKLLNKASTTYKELPDDKKAGAANKTTAIKLMLQHNTIIKRPVWDFGNDTYYLGWKEEEVLKRINEIE